MGRISASLRQSLCVPGGTREDNLEINTWYTLHGQVLEVVTSAKYLGIDKSSGYPGTPTETE